MLQLVAAENRPEPSDPQATPLEVAERRQAFPKLETLVRVISSVEQTPGSSAHIVVHPTGKWLYASNRIENSIGLFSIDSDGRPHPVSFVKDMVATPRDFSVDPSGRWLISANQGGAQNVLVFRIDLSNGDLTRMSVVDVGNQPTFTQAVVLE